MKAPPHPLSSRAKPRDLRCAPPNTQILRYQASTPKQKCHPDRSEAKWRDLLFIIRRNEFQWKSHPPLCHPERSRGICSAPLVTPNTPVPNLNPQTEVSSRP